VLTLVATTHAAQATSRAKNGRIAYASGDHIWTANPDGSDRRQITFGEHFDATPTWSPDGSELAVVHETGGISVMNADGTGLRSVANVDGSWAPTWSPDGKQIAFGSARGIGIANRDGTSLHFVAGAPYFGSEPAWSPDGRSIVFMSGRRGRARNLSPGGFDLYIMRPDGAEIRRITTSPLEDTEPSWSPDGRTIAFTRFERPHGKYCIRIFSVRPSGTALRKLHGDCPSPDDMPQWSPDGHKIVFVGERGMKIMSANGSHARGFRPALVGLDPSWEPVP
jgi:Tol biopolymer transport system component